MGDHDDGEAVVMKCLTRPRDSLRVAGSSPAQGFVEHEDLGFDRQHAGERDAAFLPAAKARRGCGLPSPPDQADAREGALDPLVDLARVKAEVGRPERHILSHGCGEKLLLGVLEHHSDAVSGA